MNEQPDYTVEGLEQLCRAAEWARWTRESFWNGWKAADIVALFVGWRFHWLDQFPDQASSAAIRLALRRGRQIIRSRGDERVGLVEQFEREMREDERVADRKAQQTNG